MNKKGLIIILIIILVFAIIWVAYDMFKPEAADANALSTNLTDENTGLDNYINDLLSNTVGNEIGDAIQNETAKDNESREDEEKTEVPSNGSTTTREEKAIELTKKEWGSEDGVYFVNESIDSQGRYIVSVRDKETTGALGYYVVDVDKQLVTKR